MTYPEQKRVCQVLAMPKPDRQGHIFKQFPKPAVRHFFLRNWLRSLWGAILVLLIVWSALPPSAAASLHTYHELPNQVTVRSRQSLRDFSDRAWQAIAFKRTRDNALQGIYVRLVGFPGAVEVDRQRPITFLAPTGQQWQLKGAIDPQTKALPTNVGQYDLQPLLADLTTALPLELQVPLVGAETAEMAIAPFVVEEWLQIKSSAASPAPVAPPLRK
jgi:hypothetical protein